MLLRVSYPALSFVIPSQPSSAWSAHEAFASVSVENRADSAKGITIFVPIFGVQTQPYSRGTTLPSCGGSAMAMGVAAAGSAGSVVITAGYK